MRIIARVVVIGLGVAAIAAATVWAQGKSDAARVRQQLIGSYRLVSYTGFDQNGTPTKLPYSVGQISYDTAGRMSAHLMRDNRPGFSANPAPESERAAAYSGYVAYFGRYEIDADKRVVTHHVEGALSPGMVGQEMPRHYELSSDGATLFLSVKNGDRVTGRLQWDRHK